MNSYFISVVAASMAVGLTAALLRGTLRNTFLFTGGVLLLLVILGPLVRADLDAFGQYLAGLELKKDAVSSGIEAENREIMGEIIREKTEAYILDKAAALGAEVTVLVEVRQGKDYPYPYAVTVTGTMTAAQQQRLSEDLEASLAIPNERQVFAP